MEKIYLKGFERRLGTAEENTDNTTYVSKQQQQKKTKERGEKKTEQMNRASFIGSSVPSGITHVYLNSQKE